MFLSKTNILHTLILVLFFISNTVAQDTFHNFGTMQIHDEGQVGFHGDVVNDGSFDENQGFTGFYSENDIIVSGTNRPVFHDVEINVEDDLYLEVSMGISNYQEFVQGRVITTRDDSNVSLDYINDAPYLGENDDRYVDGYASLTGALDFTFPIGDDFRLRPARITSGAATNNSRAAYFFENPNMPNFFNETFNTNNRGDLLFQVSIFEFWDVDGDISTPVTLTWDPNSNIGSLVDTLADLRVVGWDSNLNEWVNLGGFDAIGDIDNGEITSQAIIPDNYTVLTFGSASSLLDGDFEIFSGVSPNGDGVNDFFRINGLGNFPENEILIYNRWGVLVYQREEYHLAQANSDGFSGVSEGRVTIAQNEELPSGTYYYVLKLKGAKDQSGFLYVTR